MIAEADSDKMLSDRVKGQLTLPPAISPAGAAKQLPDRDQDTVKDNDIQVLRPTLRFVLCCKRPEFSLINL